MSVRENEDITDGGKQHSGRLPTPRAPCTAAGPKEDRGFHSQGTLEAGPHCPQAGGLACSSLPHAAARVGSTLFSTVKAVEQSCLGGVGGCRELWAGVRRPGFIHSLDEHCLGPGGATLHQVRSNDLRPETHSVNELGSPLDPVCPRQIPPLLQAQVGGTLWSFQHALT